MGIQREEQVSTMRANKRPGPSSHDDEDLGRQQEQGEGADADDHHLNLKNKKVRQLPVPWKDMAGMPAVLPGFLAEYTTEDAERFDEEMARADRIDAMMGGSADPPRRGPYTSLDILLPLPLPLPWEEEEEEEEGEEAEEEEYISPGLLFWEEEKEEEKVVVGDLRLCKAEIKMLRSFNSSSYTPTSERYLRGMPHADEIRKGDRLLSKVYAWTQEGTREIVREYDAAVAAKDGDINPSTRPADH